MNGEVMGESIETPELSQNEISRYLQLTEDEGGKEIKPIPGLEEQTDGETFAIISKEDKETVPASEKNGCTPSVCEWKECSSEDDVESRDVDTHAQEMEGLCQEDSWTASSTNGLDKNEDDKDIILKGFPEHDSELENSNSFLEKINSKDSSMLSTTDTQDEIDVAGDGLFINHSENQTENCSQNAMAKKMLSMDMETDDSLDDILGSDLDPQIGETFSIVSDSEYDEASQDSAHDKSNDVILIESNEAATKNGSKSLEIHEIKSDNDDVVTTEINKTENKKKANTTELRRSSRVIKRKRYNYSYDNEEESDIEELATELRRKSRPIMINDTKSLVEIATKQAARSTSAQRREPQLVLIGSKPIARTASPNKSIISNMNTSLYQSIVARGTTVTPVPGTGKQIAAPTTQPSQVSQASQTPTPAILPSLTDDMFVVEAPSFIVPYVYEKPSIKPFKEFVTNMGKDIEQQRIRAEKEQLENNKEKKMKQQKERQEKRDREEDMHKSDEVAHREAEENKQRNIENKDQKRHQNEEDDESWDGSDTEDSEDFQITDEDGRPILINDNNKSIGEAKGNSQSVPAPIPKSENYFDCSLGMFFINIGMGLVEEYVQADLLKQQKRKLQREKKSGKNTTEREHSISLLTNNLEITKANNKPFTCFQLKCEHCTFKTESALVLAQHLETPHMKNNMYKCNFCEAKVRSPHDILFHMEAEHNVRGMLERAPSYHQCCNCPFEDNGKGKLARHVVTCAKKFNPAQNLSPPVDWEPPAKIPKVVNVRNTMSGSPFTSPANSFGRPQFGNSFVRPPIVTGTMPGMGYRPRGRFPGPVAPRPVQAGGSIVRGSSILKQNAMLTAANYYLGNFKKPAGQPSISITPLPRPPVPMHVQSAQNANGTFVICEVCDGYIRDLDQLRNHMQWIHKVKIHPKMIYNRPPLNCQKCQFRFFTDQGLERHLLGSHGLVTSSMQDASNKGKDAGRCPVCGKVYQWKLLNHVAIDHGLTLKPAHLSYKCTVCTATFGMYKQFENHVYSAHSVVAKRIVIKTKGSSGGFQINDEITITAQPAMGVPPDYVNRDK